MRSLVLFVLALLAVAPLTAEAGRPAPLTRSIGEEVGGGRAAALKDRLFGRQGIDGRQVRSVRKFHARTLRGGKQTLTVLAKSSGYTYQVVVPNDRMGGVYVRRALTALGAKAGYSRVDLTRKYKAMEIDPTNYEKVVVREKPGQPAYSMLIPRYDATAPVLVERAAFGNDPVGYSALRL